MPDVERSGEIDLEAVRGDRVSSIKWPLPLPSAGR